MSATVISFRHSAERSRNDGNGRRRNEISFRPSVCVGARNGRNENPTFLGVFRGN
jgi:hypothetical protein